MRSILFKLVYLMLAGLIAACGKPAAVPAQPVVVAITATADSVSLPWPSPTAPAPTVAPSLEPIIAPTPTPPPPPSHPADETPIPPSLEPEITRIVPHPPRHPGGTPAAESALEPTRSAHEAPGVPSRRSMRRPLVPAAIPGVSLAANIPYVERAGGDPRQTSLDIYLPTGSRNLPALIYVHGGGWTSGDKDVVGAKAAYFTSRGFVFVSVNYRLVPAAWPAEQAADLAEAVAWVKDNIEMYGGDGARLFLLGHSAGAHLAALIASNETYLRGAGLDLRAIRGVILLDSGAYDVEQLMHSPDGLLETYRPIFGMNPATWPPVSPRAHVAPGKGIPPHLLLLATASGQRRPAAEGLAAALRVAGVYAQVADATAFKNHGTINEELGQPGDTPTAAVQAFLDLLLCGAPIGLGHNEVLRPRP